VRGGEEEVPLVPCLTIRGDLVRTLSVSVSVGAGVEAADRDIAPRLSDGERGSCPAREDEAAWGIGGTGMALERGVDVLLRSPSEADAETPRRISAGLRGRAESPAGSTPFRELREPLKRGFCPFASSERAESSA
jgi:hypothetical protein